MHIHECTFNFLVVHLRIHTRAKRTLRHFDKFTKNSTKDAYRLLIFDGHDSHLNQDFVDFYWMHNIRPFQLIPYLTHILQPADVGVFQVLKYNFKKSL